MISSMSILLGNLSPAFKILCIAALPVIELRGAIPVGIAQNIAPMTTFIYAFIGSLLPLPIIFFGIRPIFKLLSRNKTMGVVIEKLSIRTLRKSSKIKRFGLLGLTLFVAIPLPGTGVWSGALLANLLDLRFAQSSIAIVVGNLIAGISITLLSTGIFHFAF